MRDELGSAQLKNFMDKDESSCEENRIMDVDRINVTDHGLAIEKKWYHLLHKKRTLLLLLNPISLFIIWLVSSNSYIAEHVFSRGIYKLLSQGLNLVTGVLPFSLMEMELILIFVAIIVFGIRFFWRLYKVIHLKQGSVSLVIGKSILNIAYTLSVVLFLFVLLAGVNYYRYSFADYSGLTIEKATLEELYGLSKDLSLKAADIREQLLMREIENENGVVQLDNMNWREVSEIAKESFKTIAKDYPVLDGAYGTPKQVYFSKFMSRMEITGIFWPFTMEANVNIDTVDYSIPATMCHELAHLRGFMREDEANYIAYLVCKQSESLEFQYSGIMLALSYVSNQLYAQNEELYQQVLENYSVGMIADIRDEYYYWKQFEDTVISATSNSMNNRYLKANNQDDGVRSYGRMVDLLLAEYRKNQDSNN